MTRHDDPSSPRPRRAFLALAAAGAGAATAAAIASCGGSGDSEPPTETVSTTQMKGDAAALNALLDLEYTAIVGYELVLGRLHGADRALARVVLGHEQQHAAALETAVRGVEAEPIERRPAREYASTFPALRSRREALAFATDLENTAVAAYVDALGKINTDAVRVRIAAILVAEAEHLAATRLRLGRPAVPRAFVTGDTPG
jgi:rubrerythrin